MKHVKIFFLAPLVVAIFSCNHKNDKLHCYSSLLKSTAQTKEYRFVMELAQQNLMTKQRSNVNILMKNSDFIISSKLDSSIFFNTKKDKCLLLLLEQTTQDLKLDQVQVIQGTLKNGIWSFSYNRLPEVPDITYTINKKTKNGYNLNNSFTTLSNKSRMFVLNAGATDVNQCEIDQKYWFGN